MYFKNDNIPYAIYYLSSADVCESHNELNKIEGNTFFDQ
jgi:hypothetical protein